MRFSKDNRNIREEPLFPGFIKLRRSNGRSIGDVDVWKNELWNKNLYPTRNYRGFVKYANLAETYLHPRARAPRSFDKKCRI